MTIKSILCIFNGSDYELNAVNTALNLGKKHKAHVRFLHISPGPNLPYVGLYGEALVANGAIIHAMEEEKQKLVVQAKAHVTSACSNHSVTLTDADPVASDVSAQFVHLIGEPARIIGREGRLCDLIILGRNTENLHDYDDSDLIPSLFDTGRPVLLMPVAKTDAANWEGQKVSLAWDGSLQASKALFNAMPFLTKASDINLLVAREHKKDFDLNTQQSVLQYLRIHGLQAQTIVIDKEKKSIGEAILDAAEQIDTDLLVVGAYGHNRLRQMILGGVTEAMLLQSDIPLLFSH